MSDEMPNPSPSKGGGKGLSKNLGPLPVWAWGVILAVIIVIYIWLGQSRSTGDGTTDPGTGGDGGSVDVDDAINGAFRIGGAYQDGGATGNGGKDDSADTNDAWSFRAVAALVAQGVSPLAAQQAIGLYLDGEKLTAAQAELVDKAVKKIGAPPVRVPTPDIPAPATPAKPTPTPMPAPNVKNPPKNTTKSKPYTVAKGDTWTKVARRVGITAADLRALNGKARAAAPALKLGQKIKVPA